MLCVMGEERVICLGENCIDSCLCVFAVREKRERERDIEFYFYLVCVQVSSREKGNWNVCCVVSLHVTGERREDINSCDLVPCGHVATRE